MQNIESPPPPATIQKEPTHNSVLYSKDATKVKEYTVARHNLQIIVQIKYTMTSTK
jgi:hypothetical protein